MPVLLRSVTQAIFNFASDKKNVALCFLMLLILLLLMVLLLLPILLLLVLLLMLCFMQ